MKADRKECVLIFRLGSIGDTVVALPCFHAIARAYAGYRRVLLTNALTSSRTSSAESVLDGTGLIDEVIYYPVGDFSIGHISGLIRQIRRLRPVTLIYLAARPRLILVYRDLAFFKAAGIPKIVGGPLSNRLRKCEVDPVTRELEYEAHRLARVLSRVAPIDLSRPDWDLRLSPAELAAADAHLKPVESVPVLLAMAPGAKIPAKDWGPENWGALLKLLAPGFRDVALIMVGAGDDHPLCAELARHWQGPVLNLCGFLTPRETAAVLRRCRLLVCHDSGPMHLASSQLTRCVALFGNFNWPRKWYPFGSGHRVIYEPTGVREIRVSRVENEVRWALNRGNTMGIVQAAAG